MKQHPPRRIGLFGLFGIGNLGNEGSLEALLRFVREKAGGAEIVCICSNPERVRREHGIEAIPMQSGLGAGAGKAISKALLGMPGRIANMAYAMREAGKLDLMLIPGTGILDDFGERPSGAPYHLWRWCHAVKLGGGKLGFVSIGAGPIVHPLSRRLMKSAALAADYRSYRDTPSRAYMLSIGSRRPQDPVFPDLAFSLPAPAPVERAPDAPLTVALGVMAYNGWSAEAQGGRTLLDRYIGEIADYAAWLVRGGRRVKLVIGDHIDTPVLEDVRQRTLERAPECAQLIAAPEPTNSLHDVMRQMNEADIVVATRFHNVVCALRVGKPTISLGYAEKNRALLREFGLAEFSQRVDDFDLSVLKLQTEQLISEREKRDAAIKAKTADLRLQLKTQERLLEEEFF